MAGDYIQFSWNFAVLNIDISQEKMQNFSGVMWLVDELWPFKGGGGMRILSSASVTSCFYWCLKCNISAIMQTVSQVCVSVALHDQSFIY